MRTRSSILGSSAMITILIILGLMTSQPALAAHANTSHSPTGHYFLPFAMSPQEMAPSLKSYYYQKPLATRKTATRDYTDAQQNPSAIHVSTPSPYLHSGGGGGGGWEITIIWYGVVPIGADFSANQAWWD